MLQNEMKAWKGKTFTEITEQEIRLAPGKKRGSIPWLFAFNGFKY